MPRRTLPQLYARVFGWGLVIVGITGFTPLIDAGTWHNLFHVATGLIGIASWRSAAAARAYAIAFGLLYVVLAALGEETVLHGLVGGAGLAAALIPPATPAPSTA